MFDIELNRQLRDFHKPKIVKYLIVGESPPYSGEYFYKAINLNAPRRIPSKVFKAFFNKNRVSKSEYEKLLIDLRDKIGLYLEDLSEYPVNQFDIHQLRIDTIRECFNDFKIRINKLKFEKDAKKVLVLPYPTIQVFRESKNSKLFKDILDCLNLSNDSVIKFKSIESYIKSNWL